jgi:hypothetical protein
MKRLLIGLLVVGQLSACANQGTLDGLNAAKAACMAGNTYRCGDVPTWERMASEERKENAGKVALVAVAIPLIAGLVLLEAAAASQPTSSTTCSSFGRSTTCNTWSR